MESVLHNVVGYTSINCTCQDDGRPADYDTSHSGLFVDEGEHGVPLAVPVKAKGDSTFWDLVTRARTAAAIDFITHFNQEAFERRNKVLDGKTIDIGRREYTYYRTLKGYNGFLVMPKVWKGVTWVVSKLTLHLDKDANVDLIIKRDGSNLHTATVAVTGKTDSDLITDDVRIQLADDAQRSDISIYYTVDNDAKAVNNDAHCGCSGKKEQWVPFLDVEGKQSDTETDVFSPHTVGTKNASGLRIHGRLECAGLEWLETVESTYWTKSAYGRLIAKTYQLFWSVKTIEEILQASASHLYTGLKREALYGKRAKFKKLASEMVPLLASQLPESLSDCYICRDPFGISKQSL